MINQVKVHILRLRDSSLFMNAFYLMLSTFVVAICGFFFWVIIARNYDTAAVGLATTLLSVSSLLSLLSLVGFDTAFVRFLPSAKRKEPYMHSGIMIVTLCSILLASVAGLGLPFWADDLHILRDPGVFIAFVFFTTVTALNVLINAIFLAFKQARYTFIINTLFSLLKVGLAFYVTNGNAIVIFILAGAAQLVGLILSLSWLRYTFGYTFLPKLDWETLRVTRKFSFSMYTASILNLLPPTLLPLIIMYHLGPESSAYYYMAFTIASVLYTVAYASMQSVFAEGSHDEASLSLHIRKAAGLILVLLVPASLIVGLMSSFLLGAFGSHYAQNAGALLQLFAFGALPVAIYSALGAIFKVTKNLRGVIGMNIVYAGVILAISYLTLSGAGLTSVGWAWIFGNIVACVVGALFTKQRGGRGYGKTSNTRRRRKPMGDTIK